MREIQILTRMPSSSSVIIICISALKLFLVGDAASFAFTEVDKCSSTVTCAANEDCHVICNGTACNVAECLIYCPADYDCLVEADGDYAAHGLDVYAGENGDLTFTCTGGFRACYFGNVYGAAGANINVTAWGDYGELLQKFDARATGADSLYIGLRTTEGSGLYGARIFCPYHGGECIVDLEGAGSIIGTAYFWTIDSFTDIDLNCQPVNGGNCNGATMWCNNWSVSCNMQLVPDFDEANVWQCTDTTSVCQKGGTSVMTFTDTAPCNGTYDCPDESYCYVSCVGNLACGVSSDASQCIINCPDNYDCIIESDGDYAMRYADIHGGVNGDTIINCTGGTGSCRDLDVYGGENGDITITASGTEAVYGISIYGENATSLSLTLTGDDTNGISNGLIYCPYTLQSGSQNNCNIYIEGTNDLLTNAKFYAIESFTDLNLMCTSSGSGTCTGAEIHCGFSYADSCDMQLNSGIDDWQCVDTSNICNDLTFAPTSSPTDPSNSPTSSPSMTPTGTPTRVPSAFPTTAPTAAPSDTPTDAPSDAPFDAPTNAPSVAPSRSPSRTPSTAPTLAPSLAPSFGPTDVPTDEPTVEPTILPTVGPISKPSAEPTVEISDTLDTADTEAAEGEEEEANQTGGKKEDGFFGGSASSLILLVGVFAFCVCFVVYAVMWKRRRNAVKMFDKNEEVLDKVTSISVVASRSTSLDNADLMNMTLPNKIAGVNETEPDDIYKTYETGTAGGEADGAHEDVRDMGDQGGELMEVNASDGMGSSHVEGVRPDNGTNGDHYANKNGDEADEADGDLLITGHGQGFVDDEESVDSQRETKGGLTAIGDKQVDSDDPQHDAEDLFD